MVVPGRRQAEADATPRASSPSRDAGPRGPPCPRPGPQRREAHPPRRPTRKPAPAHTCRRVTREQRVPARPLPATRGAPVRAPDFAPRPSWPLASHRPDADPARSRLPPTPPGPLPQRALTREYAPQRAGPRRAPPRTSSPTPACPARTGRCAGEGRKARRRSSLTPSRAGSECAVFLCEARRCARSPLLRRLRRRRRRGTERRGGSLPPASPSRSTGTPETKNKINKLSPPPPSPKTTTQTLEGPPRAPLHWR